MKINLVAKDDFAECPDGFCFTHTGKGVQAQWRKSFGAFILE